MIKCAKKRLCVNYRCLPAKCLRARVCVCVCARWGHGHDREVSQLANANDFVDKNGQAWHTDPPNQGRRRQADVIHQNAGPTPAARRAKTLVEILSLFFPDEHLQKIVDYSQQKANILGIDVHFTLSSLKALIGFMLYRGASQD